MSLFDGLLLAPDTSSMEREMSHLEPNERESTDQGYHVIREGDRWQFIGSRMVDFVKSISITNKLLVLIILTQLPHLASDIAYLKSIFD